MQLAHPKVAQPKLEAFRPQVCLVFLMYLFARLVYFIYSPSQHQTCTAQGLFKVGPDAGPQLTRVRQDPKIPSALSEPPKGAPQRPGNKLQTIGKTINKSRLVYYYITSVSSVYDVTNYVTTETYICRSASYEFTNFFTNCLLFYFLAFEAPPLGECLRGRRYILDLAGRVWFSLGQTEVNCVLMLNDIV